MHIVKKDDSLSVDFFDMAKSLYDFMRKKFKFDCEPKIFFQSDPQNADQILAKTGFYDLASEEIHVFITNRHPKDILRSLSHELLHHIQGCEGMTSQDRLGGASDPNYLIHDNYLKGIEADAFERGNIAFREWEAITRIGIHNMENNIKKPIQEKNEKKGKIPKKKLSKYKTKLRGIADKIRKDNPKMPDELKFKIASAAAKKAVGVKGENMSTNENVEKPKVEVETNEALKNSLTYIPEERVLADIYNKREEELYQELLKKFKIGK